MSVKLSFQSWVLAGCLAVVLCTLLFVGLLTESHLREEMLIQTSNSYRGEMSLIKRLATDRWPAAANLKNVDALADQLGEGLEARVTIIARDGRVLGDSQVPAERVARLDNHGGRPEVIQALARGWGQSVRRSATLGLELLYMASAMKLPDGDRLVMRLAVPLSQLQRARERLRRLGLGAWFLGVLLSVGAAYLAARKISRPVRELTEAAVSIAGGDLSRRMGRYPGREIGELGRAFDRMADNLQARIDDVTRGRDMMAAILQAMREGVLVIDREGRALLANRSLRELLDLSEDPQQRQASEIIRNAELLEALAAVRQGRETHLRLEMRVLGPSLRRLEVTVVRLMDGDQAAGAVAVFRDMTERLHMEEVRRNFVANVSHELRTPVAAIRGAAETLLDGALASPEDARRFVEIIARQTMRMENLTVDLLALARLESGESPPRLEEVSARELAEASLEPVREMAAEKKLDLRARTSEDFIFRADAGKVEQAVVNLLHNAVKHTPSGGRVTLSLERRDKEVVISVTDNGIGIAPEHLGRLFSRFYRVDKERSRQMGGTGLGLAIVKHIVKGHGGRVDVESSPGRGSVFRLFFPAE